MYQDNVITCLACGQTTPAESVSMLPDNPYLRPETVGGAGRARMASVNGAEEVYYSDDSDDESGPFSKQSKALQMNGSANGAHVQGVKDMVQNTQKTNIHKIGTLIESNLSKVEACKRVRASKSLQLKDALVAAERVKSKLEADFNDNKNKTENLTAFQSKLSDLKSKVNEIDLMDYKNIKQIYEESVKIKKSLNAEINEARHQDLEKSIRSCTVKINFEKSDELLSRINADNDTIYIKLASNLENDSAMIYLTTAMLGNIFTEKIGSHNSHYKELIHNAFIEDGLDAPQPLDDVGDYIDYINQHTKSIQLNGHSSEKPKSPNSNPSPPRPSGSSSPDEWKTVGSKETSRKPSSFADMAKKPGNPTTVAPKKRLPFPEKTIAQTNRPHCYFKIQVDNEVPFRVLFELRPDMAPKMADNFIKLCKGLPDGRGYQGSRIFRAKANDHVLGGDFENDDGTGGHSAYEEKYFLAEQCPLKDCKGAIRMKGLERTIDGRCRVGSQFMIWVGDLEYKEYRFTLVFGKIVEGLEKLQEVSRIKAVQKSPTSWVLRQTVNVVECGVL